MYVNKFMLSQLGTGFGAAGLRAETGVGYKISSKIKNCNVYKQIPFPKA